MCPHMLNKALGRERQYVHRADLVLLEKEEGGLFAPLPSRDVLEAVDIPADDRRKRRRALSGLVEFRWIFEFDLAPLGPFLGHGLRREGLDLLMNDLAFDPDPDTGGVSNRSVLTASCPDGAQGLFPREFEFSGAQWVCDGLSRAQCALVPSKTPF